jgi:hypothetical protein
MNDVRIGQKVYVINKVDMFHLIDKNQVFYQKNIFLINVLINKQNKHCQNQLDISHRYN